MKESDITPDVIKLSKEIAEHWRMEICYGGWLYDNQGEQAVLIENGTEIILDGSFLIYSVFVKSNITKEMSQCRSTDWFPILSISDCESKLLELGITYRIDRLVLCSVVQLYDKETEHTGEQIEGKNTHEALLSALLEVLKGKK